MSVIQGDNGLEHEPEQDSVDEVDDPLVCLL